MATAPTKAKARSSARYATYLDSIERTNGMTFGEWLKAGAENIEVDDTCSSCLGTGIGNPHDDRSRCYACRGTGCDLPLFSSTRYYP